MTLVSLPRLRGAHGVCAFGGYRDMKKLLVMFSVVLCSGCLNGKARLIGSGIADADLDERAPTTRCSWVGPFV